MTRHGDGPTIETGWPFWTRRLRKRTVTFEFDGEQASALARDLRELVEAALGAYPPRVDELLHRLTFDGDYLRRPMSGDLDADLRTQPERNRS